FHFHFLLILVFLLVIPSTVGGQPCFDPVQWVFFLPILHFVLAAVFRRIVGGRMRAESVSHRLDQNGSFLVPDALNRFFHRQINREQVIAVDANSIHAISDCFLSDRFGRHLLFYWY